MKLRDYQIELISSTRQSLRNYRRILLQAPTGAGKTAMLIEMMRTANERGNRSFFCVHQDELIQQTSAALKNQSLDHGIIAPKYKYTTHGIQLASVQTLKNRISNYQAPQLIVIDEAHRSNAPTYRKIIEAYPKAFVIGLTATPQRTDGKGLNETYEHIVQGPQIRDLIDQGYLSDYDIYAPPIADIDLSDVKTTAGDYNKKQLSEAMDKPTITGDAVKNYKKIANGKRCVVMCSSIEHAEHVARAYNDAGISAAAIHGKSANRDYVLNAFKAGQIKVICNVQLLIEGVDIPSIEVVQWLRPTQSVIVWMQGNGRGLRPHEGKEKLIIIDHVENYKKHGMPCMEREWSLDGKDKSKRSSQSEVSVKQCPKCFHVYAPAPICPACGEKSTAERKAPTVDDEAELVKVEKKKSTIFKDTRDCLWLEEWQTVGTSKGYKRGWAKIRYKQRMEQIIRDLAATEPHDQSRNYHRNTTYFLTRMAEAYNIQAPVDQLKNLVKIKAIATNPGVFR